MVRPVPCFFIKSLFLVKIGLITIEQKPAPASLLDSTHLTISLQK